MKNKKVFLVLSSVFLFFAFLIKSKYAFANDMEFTDKDKGFVIICDDNFLNITSLNPGDDVVSSIKIKNQQSFPLTLFLKTERAKDFLWNKEDEADLFKKLRLTVSYKGSEIYSGFMNEIENDGICLGSFSPGSEEKIIVHINLPAPETGNEYQNKSVNITWAFTAKASHGGEEDPGNGGDDNEDKKPGDNNKPGDEESRNEEKKDDNKTVNEKIEDEKNEKKEIAADESIIANEKKPDNQNYVLGAGIGIHMPSTGEVNPAVYYSIGSAAIIFGLFLITKKKNL